MNIFVYGTLRPGEYNDHGFSGLAREVKRGTTTGKMFNRRGSTPMFPVVDFNAEGTIVGDLLIDMPERHERVRQVHRMEIGAGYDLHDIEVDCDGEKYVAIAYHFNVEDERVGIPIQNGDWLDFVVADNWGG